VIVQYTASLEDMEVMGVEHALVLDNIILLERDLKQAIKPIAAAA
jgi:hypothetical protein